MDIVKFLSTPPVIFVFVSVVAFIIFLLFSKLSFKNPDNPAGKLKSYACGEEPSEERRKPNYSQFFPFAFFFTIMHVVVLFITILPVNITSSIFIIILFLAISFISIPILFRDEK